MWILSIWSHQFVLYSTSTVSVLCLSLCLIIIHLVTLFSKTSQCLCGDWANRHPTVFGRVSLSSPSQTAQFEIYLRREKPTQSKTDDCWVVKKIKQRRRERKSGHIKRKRKGKHIVKGNAIERPQETGRSKATWSGRIRSYFACCRYAAIWHCQQALWLHTRTYSNTFHRLIIILCLCL